MSPEAITGSPSKGLQEQHLSKRHRQGSGLPHVCASVCLESHSLLKLVVLELASTAAKSSHSDVGTLSPLVCD